jgi:hypothetical protein
VPESSAAVSPEFKSVEALLKLLGGRLVLLFQLV